MTRKRKTESDLIEANFASNEYVRNKKADRKSGFVSTCKKLNTTCKSFWQVVWLEFLRLARCLLCGSTWQGKAVWQERVSMRQGGMTKSNVIVYDIAKNYILNIHDIMLKIIKILLYIYIYH